MNEKVQKITEVLQQIDPNMPVQVEEKEDGSTLIIGPFPSFILMLDMNDRPDGYIISVNADAPNAVYFISKLLQVYPLLQHYGPYAELPNTGEIVFHEEAYQVKEDNILLIADEIRKARVTLAQEESGPGLIVPEEKKLIIAGA